MKHFFPSLVAVALFITPLWAQAAGAASMRLDQTSYVVGAGDLFETVVSIDPTGEALDTARAVVTFDPNVVSVQGVRLVGSFNRVAPGNYWDNASGRLSWGAFTLDGSVTTATPFVAITFLAHTVGDGNIRISADSRAIADGEEKINVSALGTASVSVNETQQEYDGTAVLLIQSPSHEDEGAWYANSEVELAWTALEGQSPVSRYVYAFGLDAQADPDVFLDVDANTLSLTAPADDLYYFRLKGVHEDGRQTDVATRTVRVDTTKPNPIELTAQDDKILEGESAWFTFATTDETSGVLQYQVAINNSEFQVQTSPLEMEDLTPGTYFFRVSALDRAGNTVYSGVSLRVYPQGTDLSRAQGYEETGEAQSLTAAVQETVEELKGGSTLLITLVLGALAILAIIYASRRRRKP